MKIYWVPPDTQYHGVEVEVSRRVFYVGDRSLYRRPYPYDGGMCLFLEKRTLVSDFPTTFHPNEPR